MKVVAYAICRDEESIVERWWNAIKEADEVVVLDTGSTDGTDKKLEKLGAKVFRDYEGEFRFDKARNLALCHVPEDATICVSTGIDEVFDPGWRKAFEEAWKSTPGCNRLSYKFVFSFREENGKEFEESVFFKSNAHSRHGFKWTSPCHEVLIAEGIPVIEAKAVGARLCHRTLPKPRRDGYLKLLEKGFAEEPENARLAYYLGREYYYLRQYKKAIETFTKFNFLAGQFWWPDEKANGLIMLAECFRAIGEEEKAEAWALRSIALTSGPEPCLFLARLYYNQRRWQEGKYYAKKAVKCEDNKAYFRDPEAFRSPAWDLLCQFYFQLGDREKAADAARTAYYFNPKDKRLEDNARFFGIIPGECKKKAPEQDDPRFEGLTVAYSVTGNFNDKLEIALYSLLKNNRVKKLIWISEERTGNVDFIASKFGVEEVKFLDLKILLNRYLVPTSPNYDPICSKATLGRLFLAEECPEEKKVLYLDCDTIVQGSLRELWETNIEGVAAAGVIDKGAIDLWGDYTKTLRPGGIPNYLNAGVLLLNLDVIRERGISRYMISLINNLYYRFADQDVFNIAAAGMVKTVPSIWNSGFACGVPENPKIVHFVCYNDFWKNPICKEWKKTEKEFLWWLADKKINKALDK
ncbi:MAG: glycosyltransferase [Bacilli bacterium]|nr:glycosyltransferase [Bacilli bacterium]